MQEKNIITQTKKEFQSMLSTFSHEIRNPLALITSEMQMLSDSQPQLCFNEHWDNIMENLNYIRELLDELSRSKCRSQFPCTDKFKDLPGSNYQFLSTGTGLPWNLL